MTAISLMDPSPTVLKPTDTISTAVQEIMQHRYRQVPVVTEDGGFLGVFGVNCLLKLVLPKAAVMEKGLTSLSFVYESLGDLHQRLKDMEHEPISICMKQDVEIVTPDTPLVETLLVLYRNRTSIPVVDPENNKLLGMISYWDVGEKILSADG
ncbi:MAG: CBS domain-containing protein [Gammaproteobacteria bacterium (ex Lamellibrachia satsuma)]|nr:MAG: CBS domain-containing protein [Gammaproteobacteria bacterium (ex Lamellibrachia satsuma)]